MQVGRKAQALVQFLGQQGGGGGGAAAHSMLVLASRIVAQCEVQVLLHPEPFASSKWRCIPQAPPWLVQPRRHVCSVNRVHLLHHVILCSRLAAAVLCDGCVVCAAIVYRVAAILHSRPSPAL